MVRYRRVNPCLWIDGKLAEFGDSTKLLWFYLLSNTAIKTSPGLYRLTIEQVVSDLRWTRKKVFRHLRWLEKERFVVYDDTKKYVFLPNWAKHETPANRKACLSWIDTAREVPDSEHKTSFIQALEKILSGYSNRSDDPPEQIRYPCNQEHSISSTKQEHEQRPEPKTTAAPPPSQPRPDPKPRPTRDPIDTELLEITNAFAIVWNLEPSDIPTPKNDHRSRWAYALGSPKVRPDGPARYQAALLAIRGHHREATKEDSQIGRDLRHVVPEARKGGRGQSNRLDVDRYMAYVRAGGRQKPPQAPNMQSPEPSELAAQMEAEAIAEHEKYCKENGVDPKDAGAIRKLARRAEKTRRSGSGPSKAFK